MSTAAIDTTTIPPHPFFDFNHAPDHIERRHDKDELRNRLLDQLEVVLMYLFPRGKRQGTRFVVGNVQGNAGDSLVIELEGPKRGVWIRLRHRRIRRRAGAVGGGAGFRGAARLRRTAQ